MIKKGAEKLPHPAYYQCNSKKFLIEKLV